MDELDLPEAEIGLDAGRDFWCIVALPPNHHDAFILVESDDCRSRDVLPEGPLGDDNGLDMKWAQGRGWGLYKLRLHPWSRPTYEGDYDGGVNVTDVEVIHEVSDAMGVSKPRLMGD